MIRVSRSVDGYTRDAYVSRTLAGPAVPVPEVVEIDHLDEAHVYCVSRKLIHGDFGAYNVLSDGHRVTAVID